jgi:pyridoxamine 5'-phosphate oxidase
MSEQFLSRAFLDAGDPFAVFETWLDEAASSEPNDPNAASLASVDADGMPNVRIVLVKAVEASGFVFYTNLTSTKGRELLGAGKAALCFHWKTLGRQVRVRGPVAQVSDETADAYFSSRPRGSRLGAWASQQSTPLETHDALRQRVAELTDKYGDDDAAGKSVPRPPHWSGFRLEPTSFELWQAGEYRLHDRVSFTRNEASTGWTSARLYP